MKNLLGKYIFVVPLLLISTLVAITSLQAEARDPLDPFDLGTDKDSLQDSDKDKSASVLMSEAELLMLEERHLDARSKLLKALQKDPADYRVHMMLSYYYMANVGHFRLALKYVKQAEKLFEEKNGPPPYIRLDQRSEFSRLLYLLSQVRLNLDNYQGALDVLDEFTSYGFSAEWYPGTRAWILMKLGRVEEAVKVAQMGVRMGAEPGRTLNMLGILLSMIGERDASLKIFKDAITYEMSLGKEGQPATPLNNSGEVYKESFLEDKAESSWLRATSMPDGCEHVLPSLNLALLYIEQLNLSGAKKAIDNFESCVAQYPLRNGEEHRAFVNFARGRIALHSGKIEDAKKYLEAAREKRQWFGKIGTSQEDLQAGALITHADILDAYTNVLVFTRYSSWANWIGAQSSISENNIRSWWLRRRARQILSEDLSALEDIHVRNTDSMLEYPTLGVLLSEFPLSTIERRIQLERDEDHRPESQFYYDIYLAEAYLRHGERAKAKGLLESAIPLLRNPEDKLLKEHALLLRLEMFELGSREYTVTAYEIFQLNRAALRSHGFKLPVNFKPENEEISSELGESAFSIDPSRELEYVISGQHASDGYLLTFKSGNGAAPGIKVKSSDLFEAVNKLNDEVFSEEL